jgi:hypothetical protein
MNILDCQSLRILALYGPAINSAAFKKIAARSQAMFAHALLDSNAFAMVFDMRFFSKMISTYDMFMVVVPTWF